MSIESANMYKSISQVQSEDDTAQRPQRVRTLTEKAALLYQDSKGEWDDELLKAWSVVEGHLHKLLLPDVDLTSLRKITRDIGTDMDAYRKITADFIDFLTKTSTEESLEHAKSLTKLNRQRDIAFQSGVAQADRKVDALLERMSRKSERSKASSTSSSLRRKSLMKMETARASLKFAEKEAEIMREQARIAEQELLTNAESARKKANLNANLFLIKQEKEVAVAEAELQALIEDGEDGVSSYSRKLSLPVENPEERTKRYVEQSVHDSKVDVEASPRPLITPSQPTPKVELSFHNEVPTVSSQPLGYREEKPHHTRFNVNPPVFYPAEQTYYNYQPVQPQPYPPDQSSANANFDITQFLLKKELLLSRLRTYDDRPESYAIWKVSFRSIMDNLKVDAIEELDLLAKWLGPESAKHAVSLRAVYVNRPDIGLAEVWRRLDDRYGCPEMVESALKRKIANFPKLSNKDNKQLYDLSDLVAEIEATKNDDRYRCLLAYFDSSSGVIPIVEKLPFGIQEKWTSVAVRYKEVNNVAFPPFSVFVEFLHKISKTRNDPSFTYASAPAEMPKKKGLRGAQGTQAIAVTARKTDMEEQKKGKENKLNPATHCALHQTKHTLNQCKGFKGKPLEERKDLLKKHYICYKCCASSDHVARNCDISQPCDECGSNRHPTALHINKYRQSPPPPGSVHGGERSKGDPTSIESRCTQICGNSFGGKSCSKIILVNVYPNGQPGHAQRMYAIIDDQSNASLVRSSFFDLFGIEGTEVPYKLTSCAGSMETRGRKVSGYTIEAIDQSARLSLSTLIECNDIPNCRDEIPTPEVALHHTHLNGIAKHIPALDPDAEILLLVGRDIVEAHHVLDQRIGHGNAPYAQQLHLGWVIVGEACLGKVHIPDQVTVNKTLLGKDGRATLFVPCPNRMEIKECLVKENSLGETVFQRTKDDNKLGLSAEDKEFISIMDKEVLKDSKGNWEAPLPFKEPRQRLPNNKVQAIKRAQILDRSLKKNPTKQEHFVTFMKQIFDRGHAELAPPLVEGEECWYLPIFGVYHPKKPDQIRGVFDSSAEFEGVSLNTVLLKGPDMSNSLLGVLQRFRKESVAITADVEQMFYCFKVREDHRNFLRFLWYKDDTRNPLVEYRMRVHVFGNSPSPAVATYALRKTACESTDEFGTDVKDFVMRNFYVDDGLTSLPSDEQAIDLMYRTQAALSSNGNLRLHKITSNSQKVMEAFSTEDRAKQVKDLSGGLDSVPTQQSLGLKWNLALDTFTFQVCQEQKAYTRRGVLSTINSLFDPIGFVAPVVIRGKIILRNLMAESSEWDSTLPATLQKDWEDWKDSLRSLEDLNIPRMYVTLSLSSAVRKEIHIFSDASEKAIAVVAFLRVIDWDGIPHVGFIQGKAKVAPAHGHTIPRLELCAAVMAVEMAEFLSDNLDFTPDDTCFYTDSRIVLGYINNKTRRFYVYVENRVDRIKRASIPKQWQYVPSELNPADLGTRSVNASELERSMWLVGPKFLHESQASVDEDFSLCDPDNDKELRPELQALATKVRLTGLCSQRFIRFSVWRKLVDAVGRLKHIAKSFSSESACKGWHLCPKSQLASTYASTEQLIIRTVQEEVYGTELERLRAHETLPKSSPICGMSPFLDDDGLLRVGGRLNRAKLSLEAQNPIIIPGRQHIAILLIRHFHENVKHQGRHITEGAVRAAGFWIVGGRRLISSLIYKCVSCRKQRGQFEWQRMADLPVVRVTPAPPFSYVGVDVFGPWSVVARRTRGGQANSKRWAALFTCLGSRAIHIEVLEDMSSSCFINALRRFVAIRGKVREFCSDRGTNFIGAIDDLHIQKVNVEEGPVGNFLHEKGTVWKFNPPHSSHMGGSWERMIGITRRILDSMMADVSSKNLTHEVLVTFMAEVCAIVNARPIVPVSTDPEAPLILSPSLLLTQKTDCPAVPGQNYDLKDMYRAQWRRVQVMADNFWKRWRHEYLNTLQVRRKWQQERPDIQTGDVVLLKDKDVHRNDWPLGIVEEALQGVDHKVRKAVIRVVKSGKPTLYTRPISEMVLLVTRPGQVDM